jgi:hypothetical protein
MTEDDKLKTASKALTEAVMTFCETVGPDAISVFIAFEKAGHPLSTFHTSSIDCLGCAYELMRQGMTEHAERTQSAANCSHTAKH